MFPRSKCSSIAQAEGWDKEEEEAAEEEKKRKRGRTAEEAPTITAVSGDEEKKD